MCLLEKKRFGNLLPFIDPNFLKRPKLRQSHDESAKNKNKVFCSKKMSWKLIGWEEDCVPSWIGVIFCKSQLFTVLWAWNENFYDHTSDSKWNPKRNSPTKSFVTILVLTILENNY